MIVDFKSKETKLIFDRFTSTAYPGDIQRVALRKLLLIDAATSINDLRVPPGNRLEKLVGDRKGQHSIRIMTNGESVLSGQMKITLPMLKSLIMIESKNHYE